MAYQLSPGVNFSEIDLTTIVPAVGTTEGAYAGDFNWGPMDEIVTIANQVELVTRFGKPDANVFVDFWTCSNFLDYARNLKIVRANSGAFNATVIGSGKLIRNELDYLENHKVANNQLFGSWAAKYPAELGNSLKVSAFASPNSTLFTNWAYSSYFDSKPGTSSWAASNLSSNDEIHIVVVDEDGKFTGNANTVLERFGFMSKASDAKSDDGTSNYYVDVINNRSKYIWWLQHPDRPNTVNTWGNSVTGVAFATIYAGHETVSLSNGTFALASNGNIQLGYDKFKNQDEVDISLILTGDHNYTNQLYVIQNIAEFRRDCVVFLTVGRDTVVDNYGAEQTDTVAYRNTNLASSSYAFMDSGWKYQFDKYNNVYRWVPCNGDTAGLVVQTDFDRDPWWSPAGFNRGHIKNVTKLAWNPHKTNRDELYKVGINPIVTFPGEGTVLFGDKTLLAKPSAFDRLNVRRLFIVLEKAISRAAKYSLFEFNDAFTRAQFVNLVEPFLRDVQGRRGIFDFRVVCDETNNTPEVIDRNEFVGDIYIKPSRVINFIQLNFVAVRTGVSFEEVVGQF